MPKHDFSYLYDHYPAIIKEMDPEFTSHEFILRLAQQHQRLYIEALYSYRKTEQGGTAPAPFMTVNGRISKGLSSYPELVAPMGDVPSKDIFGNPGRSEKWKKL